jgi:superfamily II DNA or RNA helicase
LIIGDEAHLFAANMLTTIMAKLEDCKYRFGTTGTIADAKASQAPSLLV